MNKLTFNTLIPELTVSNIHQTKKFYVDVLGFNIEYSRENDRFLFLSFGGAQMMFEEFHDEGWNVGVLEYPYGRGINFEIGTQNIETLYERVLKAEIEPYREMKTNVYSVQEADESQKEFLIMDPDGYLLRFIEE